MFGNVSVHPNPSNGVYKVRFSAGSTIRSLEVTDVTGRLLISAGVVRKNVVNLDLTEYARGVYMLRLMGDDRSTTIRLLKQ